MSKTRRNCSISIIVSLIILLSSCAANPPEKNGKWFRGNTHTHATLSDKSDKDDVPKIAGWYRKAGYDFLLLSEHNNHVAKKKIFCHDEISVPGKFLMLCGLELSNKTHHTALGIDKYIGDEKSLQDGVNLTVEAGGVPILNHPQSPGLTAKDFISIKGLNHLEVFNGNRPDQTTATEALWDSVLSSAEGRPVYAVASDDNHYKKSKVGRGWIMVDAPALTKEDIRESIRKGSFYASTGIYLNDYIVTDTSITVDTRNGDLIIFIGKDGKVLKAVPGKKATFSFTGNELYVRAKITNRKGKSAWTQPVFYPIKK